MRFLCHSAWFVNQMLTYRLNAQTAAMTRIAHHLDVALVELVPRVAIEERGVVPGTPAPLNRLPSARIVLDGAPAWEGGWDAEWVWRETWLDARFAAAVAL